MSNLPDTARAANVYDDNEMERIAGFIDGTGGIEAAPTFDTADSSFQTVAGDVNLGSAVGDNTNTHFLAGGMFSVLGDAIATTKNYLGGVIGAFGVTGTNGTTYPSGAVLAQVSDGVTDVEGAVVAYIDGDSAVTTTNAFYAVDCNNSTPGSGASFGLDLQRASHDGYIAIDRSFYTSAPLRIVNDVCLLVGSGDPVNGTTGADVTGPGSLYFDIAVTTKAIYVNTNTKASPTWTALY